MDEAVSKWLMSSSFCHIQVRGNLLGPPTSLVSKYCTVRACVCVCVALQRIERRAHVAPNASTLVDFCRCVCGFISVCVDACVPPTSLQV